MLQQHHILDTLVLSPGEMTNFHLKQMKHSSNSAWMVYKPHLELVVVMISHSLPNKCVQNDGLKVKVNPQEIPFQSVVVYGGPLVPYAILS